MNRCVLAVSFLIASGSAAAATLSNQAYSFYGTWHIDAIAGYSEISASDEELRKLIGQTVVISSSHLKIGTDDCKADAMHVSNRKTDRLLLNEYRASSHDAHVPSRTLVLNAEPCGYVFRDGNTIVVPQDGAFYRASRIAGKR